MEIAALILGIIAIVLSWIPGCGIILGGIPALVGLILAIISIIKKKPKKKQAIVGLVLSIIAFIVMMLALLTIPIIMGLNIYNSASQNIKDTTSNMNELEDQLSNQEKEIHNDKFESYEGENVKGTTARLLCETVRTHNIISDLDRQVQVVTNKAKDISADTFTSYQTSTASNVKLEIKTGNTYTVTLGYDPDTGFVTQIGIEENEPEDEVSNSISNVTNDVI